MKKRKTKIKTKTGNSIVGVSRRSIFVSFALFAAVPAAADKKKNAADLYSIIGGSVFRDPGFALRGAEVSLEPEQPVVNGVKLKPQKAISDTRGEFAFRVAPVEAKYRVTAKAAGMASETKPAATQGGEERIDVTFMLLPASK